MTKWWLGMVCAGLLAGACGHATPTGSARNDWTTPTGYANATDPRYVNPNAAAHRAHDRSVFADRQAPTLQPQGSAISTEPMEAVPPPAEPLPLVP